MSSFITIKSIGLTNLNNAEFLAFMKGALSLLPTASEEEEERPGAVCRYFRRWRKRACRHWD